MDNIRHGGQIVNIDSMLVMHRLILNGILKWLGGAVRQMDTEYLLLVANA